MSRDRSAAPVGGERRSMPVLLFVSPALGGGGDARRTVSQGDMGLVSRSPQPAVPAFRQGPSRFASAHSCTLGAVGVGGGCRRPSGARRVARCVFRVPACRGVSLISGLGIRVVPPLPPSEASPPRCGGESVRGSLSPSEASPPRCGGESVRGFSASSGPISLSQSVLAFVSPALGGGGENRAVSRPAVPGRVRWRPPVRRGIGRPDRGRTRPYRGTPPP